MSEAQSNPLAPSGAPLAEADPNSLNDLIASRVDAIFNKTPPYSDADLMVMIDYYQRKRLQFLAESQLKETKAPAGRKRKPTSIADALASAQSVEDLL